MQSGSVHLLTLRDEGIGTAGVVARRSKLAGADKLCIF